MQYDKEIRALLREQALRYSVPNLEDMTRAQEQVAELTLEMSPEAKPIQSIDFAPKLVRNQSQSLECTGIRIKTVSVGRNATMSGTNDSFKKRDFKVRIING